MCDDLEEFLAMVRGDDVKPPDPPKPSQPPGEQESMSADDVLLELSPYAFLEPERPVIVAAVTDIIDPSTLSNESVEATTRDYLSRMPQRDEQAAWVHVLRLLLEVEPRTGLPNVIDGNLMQEGMRYADLAVRFRDELARAWAIEPEELPGRIGLLCRAHGIETREQKNTLRGRGFEDVIVCLLEDIGQIESRRICREVPINQIPRLRESKDEDQIDIVIMADDGSCDEIVSVKWSLRPDRYKQIRNEAKACRRAEVSVRFALVTAEMDQGRLRKALDDRYEDGRPLLDIVYHVAPHLLQIAHDDPIALQGYLDSGQLRPLSDLLLRRR